MSSRSGPAHVVTTSRIYKGKVYRTHLLRRSYREDGKVKNETLGNLSHLPESLIDIIRRSLQGERFVPVGEAFEIVSSLPRGHVEAVRSAMKRLDMAFLLGSKASRERDRVLAMIAARIISPSSRASRRAASGTLRRWPRTSAWLMACRNPSLACLRAKKREDLLAATEGRLRLIQAGVEAGRRKGAEAIALAVGKVIDHYKVGKHFELDIGETHFTFTRKRQTIEAWAALDGIYIIRTNVGTERMEAAECVRNYKAPANVERAFRSLKTTDLKVRPIYHRTPDRVRAHLLLCMLVYYVEWHLREAWRELTFADADLSAKTTRDPVAPARRSPAAMDKIHRRQLDDGTPVQSFSTLMAELSTLVRNTCRVPGASVDAPGFEMLTTPTPTQRRALDLIEHLRM